MIELEKLLQLTAVLLAYGLLCWVCLHRHRPHVLVTDSAAHDSSNLLIAYASQSGTAVDIARQLAASTAEPVTLLPLNSVDAEVLAASSTVLFIVSTYGEGEPPDNGARFARRFLTGPQQDFSHIDFAVLALGDRGYHYFCGFGHALFRGLSQRGAVSLFPVVEHEPGDVEALKRWETQLHRAGIAIDSGRLAAGVHDVEVFKPWRLHARHQLNVGSPGGALMHLQLAPMAENSMPIWQAGDIVEFMPVYAPELYAVLARHWQLAAAVPIDQLASRQIPLDPAAWPEPTTMTFESWLATLPPLVAREYSIASLPGDGYLDLLVRQQCSDGGEFGLASGWLTAGAELGATIQLRFHPNSLFHAPMEDTPLILIGNGSGYAGLRAILRARQQAGLHKNALFFGERCPRADRIFDDEIRQWQESGHLQQLHRTFSRCPLNPAYVQDALRASESLQSWVDQGAVIMVCGSRHGMAEGVDVVLRQVLGDEQLNQLQAEERYRRDVY